MKQLTLLTWLAAPLLCAAQTTAPSLATSGSALPALRAPAMPASGVEGIEQLRAQLKLTPPQQALWDAYLARLDAYTQQFYRERPAQASEDEPAPQQIARLVMNHQNRLSGLEDIEQAAKVLYNSLDADQKKTANLGLLASIPLFTGLASGSTSAQERRPELRPGGEMRRRGGGGMSGMGSGRF